MAFGVVFGAAEEENDEGASMAEAVAADEEEEEKDEAPAFPPVPAVTGEACCREEFACAPRAGAGGVAPAPPIIMFMFNRA